MLACTLPSSLLVVGEVHHPVSCFVLIQRRPSSECSLPIHDKNASKQSAISSKTPVLGTAALMDLRGEEDIELAASSLNPAVSPSLQARVNLNFCVYFMSKRIDQLRLEVFRDLDTATGAITRTIGVPYVH